MDIEKLIADNTADPSLVAGGADLDYGNGVVLKVAMWGNPRFNEVLTKLMAAKSKLNAEDDIRIMDEVIADTILVGWSGIENGGGQPLPYSRETALRILKTDFIRPDVVSFARTRANYRLAQIAEGAETLKKSSSGT